MFSLQKSTVDQLRISLLESTLKQRHKSKEQESFSSWLDFELGRNEIKNHLNFLFCFVSNWWSHVRLSPTHGHSICSIFSSNDDDDDDDEISCLSCRAASTQLEIRSMLKIVDWISWEKTKQRFSMIEQRKITNSTDQSRFFGALLLQFNISWHQCHIYRDH